MTPDRKLRKELSLRDISYDITGRTLGKLVETVWDCDVSRESRLNLQTFSDHLKEGSGVVAINHINYWDGPIMSLWLLKELGGIEGNLRILGGPESQKHFDFKRDPGQALILRTANLLGLEFMPVVQLYDLKSYPRELRKKILYKYISGMRHILGQPGGVGLIAPEGTRSLDANLQRGMRGVADLRLYGGDIPLSFVAGAIVPKGDFDNEWNLGKVELRIGSPFDMEMLTHTEIPDKLKGMFPPGCEGGAADSTDLAMLKIAEILPEKMRGVYADYFRE